MSSNPTRTFELFCAQSTDRHINKLTRYVNVYKNFSE